MAVTFIISWAEFDYAQSSQVDLTDIAQILEDQGYIQVTTAGLEIDAEGLATIYQSGGITGLDVSNLFIEVINNSRIEVRFLNEGPPATVYGPRDFYLQIDDPAV